MIRRGLLIVIEGPDGVGKTTLAEALTAELRAKGQEVRYMSFPGREPGTLGKLVYRVHHDRLHVVGGEVTPAAIQALHVAAHLDAIESRILPELDSGCSVILDRYWWSTWIYGLIAGVPQDLLESMIALERKGWRELRPTVAFLVARSKPWRAEDSLPRWRKLLKAYKELTKRESQQHAVVTVKNDRAIPKVVENLVSIIMQHLRTPPECPTNEAAGGDHNAKQEPTHQDFQLPLELTPQHRLAAPAINYRDVKAFAPAVLSHVFDTYWRFAAERQRIFFRRFAGFPPPWTEDPIFARHKFTNAYRASDRVSQYLIKKVIYRGDQRPEEIFFRTILFKLFNRIETWELLEKTLGTISTKNFSPDRYSAVLTTALSHSQRIYSAAYIMPAADRQSRRKHIGHLQLLNRMLRDELPVRLQEAHSLREAFEQLRSYPMMGDFLAYQYIIDLNYSTLLNFSEMEFIVPGPGAKSGIRKCFRDAGGLSDADLIRIVTERQEEEFLARGLSFQTLWGRPLQLVDCQNLFCEVDKYARVAHPEVKDQGGRERIKQVYRRHGGSLAFWYPPKWELNEKITQESEGTRAPVHRNDR